LRAKKLFRSNSSSSSKGAGVIGGASGGNVIEWEVRPGGMLVQKRQSGGDGVKEVIRVRVSTGSKWHDMSIGATCTFGEYCQTSWEWCMQKFRVAYRYFFFLLILLLQES